MALSGSTPIPKVIALTLIVFGIGLLVWGYQLSDSFNNQLSIAMTGASSDRVMYSYIGGAASFVVGLYLYFKK